jgi:predicted molibdopterin-dependent oxidoreductase YjgC
VRCQALPNEHVNDFWICDKGRFAFHYVDSEDRLTTPLVRKGEEFESTSWGAALKLAAEKLGGAERVGVLAGGHLTTEDAFAVARVAKKVLKTPNVDSRIQDAGAPYELAIQLSGAAGSTATLDDLESAHTIVWAGADPKETLPVLYLRLRKAVLDNGAKLIVVSPRRTSLDTFATLVIRSQPDGAAEALKQLVDGTGDAASDIGDPLVVCWEHSSPGRDETAVFAAAIELARARGGGLLVCTPHAGSQGLIDMGAYPVLDAGYKPAASPGMDTRAMLEAAAAGELDALVLVGADPIGDFPDSALARRALEKVPFTLVVELFATASAELADVVLPSAANPERDGTYTNLERRLQKLEPLVPAPGSAREPWRAMAGLAAELGGDFGWSSIDDVWNDIRKEVPTHSGMDLDRLTQSVPPTALQYESGFEADYGAAAVVAGPGGGYPKGWRSGAPFQTGQNWPLSWELRAFEAKQRPGVIPDTPGAGDAAEAGGSETSASGAENGSFAFLTGRLIYDEGSMVRRTSVLRAMAKRPYVEMNDEDVKALDLADGDEVILAANGTEQRCRLVVADIARGAVFVPYDQAGLPANSLIGGGDPVVEVRPA